jgi:hypothetical protein
MRGVSTCGRRTNAFPNPEIMVTLAAAVTERIWFAGSVAPMHIAGRDARRDFGGRVARPRSRRARRGITVPSALAGMTPLGAPRRRHAGVWAGEHEVQGALQRVDSAPVQRNGPELLAPS